jgi:hypothetical protein
VVSYRTSTGTLTSVEHVPHSAPSLYVSDTVIAEALNQEVTPSSLYKAQLKHRFGSEKESGIFVVIDGPQYGLTNTTYTWKATRSVGPSSMTYDWYVNDVKKGSGAQFSHKVDSVGKTTIKVIAKSPKGSEMSGVKEFWTSDPSAVIVQFSNSYIYPLSLSTFHAMRKWHAEATQDKDQTISAYLGIGFLKGGTETNSTFGIAASDWSAGQGDFGGILYTELPAEGIAIAKTKLSANLGPTDLYPAKDLTILAVAIKDINGNWAMSKGKLEKGVQSIDFSKTEWVPLDTTFHKKNGAINSDKITSIGFCVMRKDTKRGGSDGFPLMIQINNFLLTASEYAVPVNTTEKMISITPSLIVKPHSIAVAINQSAPYSITIFSLNGKLSSKLTGDKKGIIDLTAKLKSSSFYIIKINQNGKQHQFSKVLMK